MLSSSAERNSLCARPRLLDGPGRAGDVPVHTEKVVCESPVPHLRGVHDRMAWGLAGVIALRIAQKSRVARRRTGRDRMTFGTAPSGLIAPSNFGSLITDHCSLLTSCSGAPS